MSELVVNVVVKGAQKAAGDLEKVSGAGRKLATAGGLVASASLAAGAALGEWINRTVDLIDQVDTLSKSSGLSTSTINGLRLAAQAAGKTLQEVVPKELAKKMEEARRGSKTAAESFAALGVSAADLQSMSPDETLAALLDGLSRIEDPGRRAALAFQTMGTEGQNLLSTLGDSAALDHFVGLGEKFGTKVGPEAAASMKTWRDANAKLSLAFEDLQSKLQPIIGPSGKALSNFTTGLYFSMLAVGNQIGIVAQRMYLISQGEFGQVFDDIAEKGFGIQASISAAVQATYDFEKAVKGVDEAAGEGVLFGPPLPPDMGASGTLRNVATSATKAKEAIRDVKEEHDEWAETARAWYHEQVELEEAVADKKKTLKEQEEARRKAADARSEEAQLRFLQKVVEAEREARSAVADMFLNTTDIIIGALDTQTEKGRAAAMVLFGVHKAGSIAQIAVDAGAAIMRQYRELPLPLAIPASVTVGAVAATQIAAVAATQPSFHIGHRAADEYSATLRAGERVLAPQAVDALGGPTAVAQANAGASPSGDGRYVLELDGEAIGTALLRRILDPDSPLAGQFRGMTPAVR